MKILARLAKVPAVLFALFIGLQLGGVVNSAIAANGMLGIPNVLTYDTWQGRTALNTINMGATGGTLNIQKSGTGDMTIGPTSANSVMGVYVGSAGGARTAEANFDLNGMHFSNSSGLADSIDGNNVADLVVKGGTSFGVSVQNNTNSARVTVKSGGTIDIVGPVNSETLGVSGVSITQWQHCSVTYDAASVAANTCRLDSGATLGTLTGCTYSTTTYASVILAQPSSGLVITPSNNAGTQALMLCNPTTSAQDIASFTFNWLIFAI